MTIRPMQDSDLDRVLEIAGNLAQAPRWAREVYETAIRPGSAPRRVALVAEEAGLWAWSGLPWHPSCHLRQNWRRSALQSRGSGVASGDNYWRKPSEFLAGWASRR